MEASARLGQAPAFEVEKLNEESHGQRPVPGVSLEGTDGNTAQDTTERDALGGFSGDDELPGYGGDEMIGGDLGNDTLYGDASSDVLLGGDSDDVLDDGADGGRVGPVVEDIYQCEDMTVR